MMLNRFYFILASANPATYPWAEKNQIVTGFSFNVNKTTNYSMKIELQRNFAC